VTREDLKRQLEALRYEADELRRAIKSGVPNLKNELEATNVECLNICAKLELSP
jgi:hypothetical protein